MASGIGLNEECLRTFQELKLGKKLKYVLYGVSEDNKEIIVLKTSESANYQDFLNDIPPDGCRWAVYDLEYDLGEGPRKKLAFIAWSPDTAKIKEKMVYASSKDTLRRSLVGIKAEIQGTEPEEIAYETVVEKLAR